MSKYIIDIPKTVGMLKAVVSMRYTYFDGIQCKTIILKSDEIEELNSDYINEHYSSLQDEAYKRGINDGSLDVKQRVEGAYQRGLNDAWECAKKLFSTMSDTEIEKVFPTEWKNGFNGLMQMKPQYAMAKIKAYEEKQKAEDEIKVGDEVETKDGKRFVVTTFGSGVDCEIAVGVCADGLGLYVDLQELRKTGRHFDIASILEDMRND